MFETVHKQYEEFTQAFRDTSDMNTEIKSISSDISDLQGKIKVELAAPTLFLVTV